METIDLLRRILLFKGCTKEDIELVSGLFQERQIKAGTTIFNEKMPAEALFIVKSGTVRIFLTGGEGEDVGVLQLGPGDFFGEIALIQESTRAVSARAETASDILILTRKDFLALFDLDPRVAAKISLAIARLLAMRVKAYSNKLREMLLS